MYKKYVNLVVLLVKLVMELILTNVLNVKALIICIPQSSVSKMENVPREK